MRPGPMRTWEECKYLNVTQNNKIMKKLLTCLAAVAMLAGCSKNEGGVSGPMRVTIDPTITRATEVDFETGDAIGVTIASAGAKYAENKKFVFGEDKFAAEGGLLWYEDINAAATLFAYYPYAAGAAVPGEFTVAADQNGAGYTASDLMTARKEGVYPTPNAVGMTFRHKMARLILTVENSTNAPVTRLDVKGAIGTAVLDTEANTVAVKNGAEVVDVVAREVTADAKYYALVVPQSVKFSVAVTTAEGTRTQSYTETELVGGKSYPVTVRVKPAAMEVTVEGPIEGWEDGDEIPAEGEGDITPDDPTILEYAGEKYKTVVLKDGRTWMAENLRYVPAGKTPSSDPTDGSGVWYPCNLSKAADADLVKTNGLIYSYPVLLGMEGGLTAENYNKYEGAQGICPEGWHVPTMAEWLKVAGQGSGNLKDSTSPYFDAAQSGAPLSALNADGFNMTGCGYINAGNITAKPAYMANASNADATAFGMAYYAGSTGYQVTYNTAGDAASGVKNIQFYAGMVTYNTSFQRLQVAYQGGFGGAPVRCVKNAE